MALFLPALRAQIQPLIFQKTFMANLTFSQHIVMTQGMLVNLGGDRAILVNFEYKQHFVLSFIEVH